MTIVKPYEVGRAGETLVVVIPKEVREKFSIKKGIKLYVKVDDNGRIIYEPLK